MSRARGLATMLACLLGLVLLAGPAAGEDQQEDTWRQKREQALQSDKDEVKRRSNRIKNMAIQGLEEDELQSSQQQDKVNELELERMRDFRRRMDAVGSQPLPGQTGPVPTPGAAPGPPQGGAPGMAPGLGDAYGPETGGIPGSGYPLGEGTPGGAYGTPPGGAAAIPPGQEGLDPSVLYPVPARRPVLSGEAKTRALGKLKDKAGVKGDLAPGKAQEGGNGKNGKNGKGEPEPLIKPPEDPVPASMRVEDLERKLDSLRSRYTDNHPDVKLLKAALEKARAAAKKKP